METTTPPPSKRFKKEAHKLQQCWWIYPPPRQLEFKAGQQVFFRPKSAQQPGRRGSIVVDTRTCNDNDNSNIKHVGFQSSSSSKVIQLSRKRLLPVYWHSSWSSSDNNPKNKDTSHAAIQPATPTTTTVLLTRDTTSFRHLAASQVVPTDHILEIGCSTGETSAILVRYGSSWVGFDTSASMVDQCQARFAFAKKATCHAFCVNALVDPDRAREHAGAPTAVFVDINGNRDLTSVLQMLSWVFQFFATARVVVVKSQELVDHIMDEQNKNMKSDSDDSPHTSSPRVDTDTGRFWTGPAWFEAQQSTSRVVPKHALQAPLVYSPTNSQQPICRYHNYHVDGCAKGKSCPLDHHHCHWCREAGHLARMCPQIPQTCTLPINSKTDH